MHRLAGMAYHQRSIRRRAYPCTMVGWLCRRHGSTSSYGFHREHEPRRFSPSRRRRDAPRVDAALWRFRAGPGVEGVVANLVRHINQEARPLEERTLLIAERDSSRRDERFNLAYYDRSQGAEETVESRDVLALARQTPDAQPMLVLGRDYGDGMAYAIVQRDPSGRWREKWHSPRGRCK